MTTARISVAMALVAFAGLSQIGCGAVGTAKDALAKLTDDELAAYVQAGAKEATSFGIGFAMKKYPDKAAQIRTDGQNADQVLRTVIIPIFSKVSTGSVARSAVTDAVALLGSKLSATQADGILLVANTVLTMVPLPANPADKLDVRTAKAVAAFFTGMAEGDESALGLPNPTPAPAPAPVPVPAPPPPAPPK